MTVRELINALLYFDADEEIHIVDSKEKYKFNVIEFGHYSDLPYITIKKERNK